jgi:hypothetical protein
VKEEIMNSQFEKNALNGAQRVDLTEIMQDASLSLNPLAQQDIRLAELAAKVKVYDPDEVFATDAALSAIKRAYLTVPYLIQLYANNYVEKLFRVATRGNDKGRLILDSSASTYLHKLNNGGALVVQGETVEVDGALTRRLTVSCCDEQTQGGAV